jgi:hypothetical protein
VPILLAIVIVGAVVVVLRAGRDPKSMAASERQIRSGFVDPLVHSGLSVEVLDACHYDRSRGAAWHLSVKLAVAASPDVVTRALRATTHVVIVHADTSSPGVQQYPGEPNRGWNGGYAVSGNRTLISLVKNNVHTSDSSIPVAWMPICPESRFTP